jgi:hypothetical protein
LVHLVEPAVDNLPARIRIAQIGDHEIIRYGLGVFMEFDVGAANPVTFPFQPFYQVTADEATGSANKRCLHFTAPTYLNTVAFSAKCRRICNRRRLTFRFF